MFICKKKPLYIIKLFGLRQDFRFFKRLPTHINRKQPSTKKTN